MKTIEAIDLSTVTGGAATVSGSTKLDDATTQALTKLSSDVKDLAKAPNQNSQLTQLMTVMVMSRFANR